MNSILQKLHSVGKLGLQGIEKLFWEGKVGARGRGQIKDKPLKGRFITVEELCSRLGRWLNG